MSESLMIWIIGALWAIPFTMMLNEYWHSDHKWGWKGIETIICFVCYICAIVVTMLFINFPAHSIGTKPLSDYSIWQLLFVRLIPILLIVVPTVTTMQVVEKSKYKIVGKVFLFAANLGAFISFAVLSTILLMVAMK